MNAIVNTQDVFGHTIFCDDIRFEADGKITYVGTYNGVMFAHTEFPLTIPKFAIAVFFSQKKEVFKPDLGLRIFLPGDSHDKASIEGKIKNDQNEVLYEDIIDNLPTEEKIIKLTANLIFAPLIIKAPGLIKVRVLRDAQIHRLGALGVALPSSSR